MLKKINLFTGVEGVTLGRGTLSILIYHRVLKAADPYLAGHPDAATFERQMQLIARYFAPLPLSEAVERLKTDRLPRRAVAITFDDGYADNAEVALPILRRCGLSATFFISTGYLDGGRMWNDSVIESVRRISGETLDCSGSGIGVHPIRSQQERINTIKKLLFSLKYMGLPERSAVVADLESRVDEMPSSLMMTSDQVRHLQRSGMEVGGHTRAHPILAAVDSKTAWNEIVSGRDELEAIVGTPVRLFAYPNGIPGKDYSMEHVDMVKRAGFLAAVSTKRGISDKGDDLFQLARYTPWGHTSGRFMVNLVRNYFES